MLSDRARRFLDEVRFGVLATVNPDGMPQQTEMWYERQGDEIMMNTARGRRKERNLRRDPRVSLCVADGGRFVTVTGRATLNDDQAIAQADIARLALRYDGPEAAAKEIVDFRKQHRVTIRVPIGRAIEEGI